MSIIPIDEIFPGASARLAVIETLPYVCARDIIMHFANTNNKQASQIWLRLSDEQLKELSPEQRSFKFPGQGQSEQPVLSFKGILKLIMWIGGRNAKMYRSAMVEILQKYYAGDSSLLEEVEANAQSAGPIQQMARASLVGEAVPMEVDALELPFKKRRMELELAREEAEIQAVLISNDERRIALGERRIALDGRKIEHVNTAMGSINALKDWANVDERTKMQAEDHIKNVLFGKAPQRAITDGSQAPAPPVVNETESLSVSVLAVEMGYKCSDKEIINIGRAMAAKYRAKYQREPSKHKQNVKGNYIPVNSYMERDRALMEQAIREIMVPRNDGNATESSGE